MPKLHQAIVCKLWRHAWENWQPVSPESCAQYRYCRRCGKRETRTSHDLKEWKYVADGSCNQVSTCRCNEDENYRVHHDWLPWEYQSGTSCTHKRICQRCKISETREHVWNEWGSSGYHLCKQERTCLRCGEADTRWQHGPTEKILDDSDYQYARERWIADTGIHQAPSPDDYPAEEKTVCVLCRETL